MPSLNVWWQVGKNLCIADYNQNTGNYESVATSGDSVVVDMNVLPTIGNNLDDELNIPEDIALGIVAGVLAEMSVIDKQENQYKFDKMVAMLRNGAYPKNDSGTLVTHGLIR